MSNFFLVNTNYTDTIFDITIGTETNVFTVFLFIDWMCLIKILKNSVKQFNTKFFTKHFSTSK